MNSMTLQPQEKLDGLRAALQAFEGRHSVQSIDQLRTFLGDQAKRVLSNWIENGNGDLRAPGQFRSHFRNRILKQISVLKNASRG